jgi:hypothetical protein
MPDSKGNLFLFEAILLRNEYDRYVKLLEKLIDGEQKSSEGFFRTRDEEKLEPASGFNQKEIEEELVKIKVKRIKLNLAVQTANYKYQIDYQGEKISIAEALEIRKNLLTDIGSASQRVADSAFKRIIHKEERDIIHEPKHPFKQSYDIFCENLKKLRTLIILIDNVNYKSIVNFREE